MPNYRPREWEKAVEQMYDSPRYHRRTKAEVLVARGTVIGCCSRHADNMSCDCLEEATRPCPECGGSGYAVHPQNGRVRGFRCSRGCDVRCSICSDPNCDNPGGQH